MRYARWAGAAAGGVLLAAGLASAAAAQPAGLVTRGSLPPLPDLKGTSLPAIHKAGHPQESTAGIPVFESGNWSGYVSIPKSGSPTTFKYVYAQYTVPSVNCTPSGGSDAFAYHWIGLDGWTDGTVEQDGIADFCVGGTPEYDAWYEMYPNPFSLDFAVSAGDAISSSVTYNPGTGKYALVLKDETSGQGFSVSQSCPSTCNNSSAEDITEGYTSGGWIGTADFGQEFYNSFQAEDAAGTYGSLNNPAWATDESVAYGGTTGTPDTLPGQLYNGSTSSRSALEITWKGVD